MKLSWEDPIGRTSKKREELDSVMDQLRSKPGNWAKLFQDDIKTARAKAGSLRERQKANENENWEFTVRSRGEDGFVYGRFLGNGKNKVVRKRRKK